MAKKSILDIVINVVKKGDGNIQVVKDLAKVKNAVSQAGMVFGALAGAAYTLDKAFDATGGKFVTYANEVRGFVQSFSMEAEEASRLIQVMDDLGISQDTLNKGLRTMANNGIPPSLAGLQQLAGQFQNIQDPAKQAAFLMEQFGAKTGLEMAAAMRIGKDGLEEMNSAVEDGLVLTKDSLSEARKYEIQVDQLKDTWDAFAMGIGQEVVPALNDMLIHMQAQQNVNKEFIASGKGVVTWSQEYQDAVKAETEALKAKQQAQIDAEMGLSDLTDTTELAITAERALKLEQENLAIALSGKLGEAISEHIEKMDELKAEYWDLREQLAQTEFGTEEWDALNEKLQENADKQKQVAENTRKATSEMLYQKTAATLDAKGQLELARALGKISETDYEAALAIDALTEKYDANKDGIVSAAEGAERYIKDIQDLKTKIQNLPDQETIDIYVNYITTGTPPPGGGCFLAGTRVLMADNARRPIETVKVGEYVMTYDFRQKENVPARVCEVFHHAPEETNMYLVINHDLQVTPNHRIYTSEGWKAAGDLRIGHEMTLRSGEPYIVEQIDLVKKNVAVYNLHVDHPDHNYYANEILVHNVKTDESGESNGYAAGGVATGPDSGHWELLHGTEAIIPLRNGAVPVQIMGGGDFGGTSNSTSSVINNYYLVEGQDAADILQQFMNMRGG